MPVKKFHSIAEMGGPLPVPPFSADNIRVACELSELAFALHPWRFEPGLYKFRSIEEANRRRQKWERDQVRRS